MSEAPLGEVDRSSAHLPADRPLKLQRSIKGGGSGCSTGRMGAAITAPPSSLSEGRECGWELKS